MKFSVPYFFGILTSTTWLFSSFADIKLIVTTNEYLLNQVSSIKVIANTFLEFPITLSEYLLQNDHLKQEIQVLRIENDHLKIELSTKKNVEKELQELKKAAGLNYEINAYKYMEKVLGFDRGLYNSFMLISAKHKGVKPGCIVLSSNGLVGLVHSVNRQIAKVIHVHDKRLKIPVKTDQGDHMIIQGAGKNKMIITEIFGFYKHNLLSRAQKGGMLTTSGEGGIFPRGIPVARLHNKTSKEETALPVTSITKVSYVWIINPISSDY